MKVCFVGIGSIAKRHIRNLREVCYERGMGLIIDAYRRELKPSNGVDHVYTDLNEVPNDYDAIFITNPTNLHLDALRLFHEKGRHFFIEKPLVFPEQIAEAEMFATRKDSIYYIAAPLRYSSVIQYIKNDVDLEKVISVRCISSSYLPDWRPGQDYRETYSAHKDMGGGVSIDLIHEWDYLTYLLGKPQKVSSFIGKKSALEIDSDDYAIYIAEYEKMIAELHLDYFGRKAIRKIELFTDEDTIEGDLISGEITYLKSGKQFTFSEGRDDYQKRELEHFIDMILNQAELEDDFQRGLDLIELTQGRLRNI